jgi:hypothetical protein
MILCFSHRLRWSLALAALAGCGGDEAVGQESIAPVDGSSESAATGPVDAAPNQDVDSAARDDGDVFVSEDAAVDALEEGPGSCKKFNGDALLTFNLTSGAFPGSGHPDVAVHVPAGFDPCNRPGVIVVFHGFDNCVTNFLGASDGSCSSDGAVRPAMHLADQIDAAGVNAMLVAPQLRFDAPSSDPGQLTNAGRLRDLLHELLVDHLDPLLGKPLDVPDIDRVVVSAFGGGYVAAATAVQNGGLAQLTEVDLYDALFGNVAVFESWIQANLARFDAAKTSSTRFADFYTTAGGTLSNSQATESAVSAMLGDAGSSSFLFDSRSGAAPTATDLLHPLIFARVDGSSDDLARTYFSSLVRASGFAVLK